MVTVLTDVVVAPDHEDEWEQVWCSLEEQYRTHAGFHRARLLHDAKQPSHYLIESEWDAQEQFDDWARQSGLYWLNRGLNLWTEQAPMSYDEVTENVEGQTITTTRSD